MTRADQRAVAAALASGALAQGDRVARFESAVAQHVGAIGGCATASGSAALCLALQALRLPATAEIVLPTYVCRSVLNAVWACGLEPVLCDVESDGCLSVDTVRRVLGPRTAAVIAVHIFGVRADVPALARLGLPIIEDACQRFPPAGEAAGPACVRVFSFHATKCLTTGEGGMVVTSDTELLGRLHELREGSVARGPRIAAPLSDMQAALGLSQLARYSRVLARRRALAERYFQALAGTATRLPEDLKDRSIFFRFPVRAVQPFESLRLAFSRRGVQVRRGVDALLHQTTTGLPKRTEYRGAEAMYAEVVSLPLYPALRDAEQQHVIMAVQAVLGGGRRCA